MDSKILVFALLACFSCLTPAHAVKISSTQCTQAHAEVEESSELLMSLASRWISSDLSIDYTEFSAWRKDYFNPKYNSIRDRYHATTGKANGGNSDPRINANKITFRAFEFADEIQLFAKSGDKEALQTAWAGQSKAFKEDINSIRKQCPK